jgi:uncharacterized protein (DUF1684 family)
MRWTLIFLGSIFMNAAMSMNAASPSGSFVTQVEKWREGYEQTLKAPDGWLSVSGLFWLHEGENTVGSDAQSDVVLPARFARHAGSITLKGDQAILRTDAGDFPMKGEKEPLSIGNVSLAFMLRNHKYAIRMRDPEAETRVHFHGTKWFPPREELRVEAKWMAYEKPREIPIVTILGYTEAQPSPGVAEFQLDGKTFHLTPVVEEPGVLFFIFKDQTAGHETYGAGRFLKAEEPKDGKVVLDFNRAYNPPCAYTAFATCPLPPKENVLTTRVEAGELKYGSH